MKLQLNKKKLKNLSKDVQILPEDMTPNVAGGTRSLGGACNPIITRDWGCDATGTCGCNSQYDCTNTNTCM